MEDGKKLVPSVTRVFSKSRDMYVYLQAYEPRRGDDAAACGIRQFYRGQIKAFETSPLPVTDGLDPQLKALPLRFACRSISCRRESITAR